MNEPKLDCLLGEVPLSENDTRSYGGLNPYNPAFDRIGTQFLHLLIEHAGLSKKHRILDVGCGTGRLTKPLSTLLTGGTYCGFDVNQRFLDYCTATYPPNFKFTHCDIAHPEYNRSGTIDPTKFIFPYNNRTFDLVTAIAVFSHFHTPWVAQYIREISRVLKPRGIMFATILLLNKQSMEVINTKTESPYNFPYRLPESWHDFENRPLFKVAHPEEAIRRMCIKSSIMLKEPIRYGGWCNSPLALVGPDIIMARKGGWHT